MLYSKNPILIDSFNEISMLIRLKLNDATISRESISFDAEIQTAEQDGSWLSRWSLNAIMQKNEGNLSLVDNYYNNVDGSDNAILTAIINDESFKNPFGLTMNDLQPTQP